uniref:Transcriptional coactivator p15 (PC4) C-terminal domain-containing protein n=1 Tax=Oryza rufipogon TaxID=4529 RepID=A0A0E0NGB6_ORYRU
MDMHSKKNRKKPSHSAGISSTSPGAAETTPPPSSSLCSPLASSSSSPEAPALLLLQQQRAALPGLIDDDDELILAAALIAQHQYDIDNAPRRRGGSVRSSKMKITWGKNAKTNRQPSVAPSKPGLPFGVDSDNDETEKEETRVVTTDCPGTKPSDNAESLKHQGNRLAEEGKYHEALGKWEAALTLMPNNAILHEQKAQILLELGDAWRALTAATRATELDPLWPEGWVTLGRAQLNFGEPDSAILSFDKALAIEPDNNEAKSDRETAARLVKKRGQLHSSGLSANKRRFTVGEDSEKEKDDSQMEDVEKCKEDEEKERDDSQLENVDSIRTFLLQDSTSPEGESVRRMWRKGNKRFGGGGEPAAKRRAAGDDGPSESADDDIVVAQISKNRRVAVRTWNGKVVVDIREFYEKDGKTLPGRKGIQLPMDQWKILRDNIKAIDEAIKENA